ncbi:uncharacterized protein LOC115629606 [Scaptodrosophila lebanonensis]|uniref:Uncharacterized protein LOC115629606 n=1 Tax=Drosophila lebanonensis TaxID=7225 RepID=A0A6J2U4A4_DROLE|nr:uncharacterized protein LOC115629606 [Scaptodrosophila lebanonensis]
MDAKSPEIQFEESSQAAADLEDATVGSKRKFELALSMNSGDSGPRDGSKKPRTADFGDSLGNGEESDQDMKNTTPEQGPVEKSEDKPMLESAKKAEESSVEEPEEKAMSGLPENAEEPKNEASPGELEGAAGTDGTNKELNENLGETTDDVAVEGTKDKVVCDVAGKAKADNSIFNGSENQEPNFVVPDAKATKNGPKSENAKGGKRKNKKRSL